MHFTISLHQISVLIRGAVSLEGGEFIVIVFYYFIASEICPDKRGGSPLRGGGEFIVIVFYYFIASEICPDKRGGSLEGGRVYCHCILLFHCIRNFS